MGLQKAIPTASGRFILTGRDDFAQQDVVFTHTVSKEQIEQYLNDKETPIQNIFPNLSTDEREFIISGMYPPYHSDVWDDEE